jgi:two-component system chemotaxis response regulator CheB
MAKLRVLVIEDSLTIRRRLVEVLSADRAIEVVGEAADGRRGRELCQALRPDVVTVDMMMPVMTGLATTEHIMAYCPTPILIVSSSTNRGELFKTYDALAAGAVDVLDKPTGNEVDDDWERRLVSTVKLVARIPVITHPRAKLRLSTPMPLSMPMPMPTAAPTPAPALAGGRGRPRVVAIGASTGGPAALLRILQALPRRFPLPILTVIHLAASFASAFAEWLSSQSPLPVRYATDGEPLPPEGVGQMLLAPPDCHLTVQGDRLRLTHTPERHSCRPSVDELFQSLAAGPIAARCVACLLTGMGRDGADGLLRLRRAGALTLAQDQATCVVFGMPREAILLEAAERVLPLDRFAPTLIGLAAAGAPGEVVTG